MLMLNGKGDTNTLVATYPATPAAVFFQHSSLAISYGTPPASALYSPSGFGGNVGGSNYVTEQV